MTQMQGIVSILRSDNLEKTTKVAPLRRTLSTDMSSKSWLAETGMKRVASSDQIVVDFPHSSPSDSSDEEECDKANEGPKRIDIWTAIMSQKKQDDSGPTYVHPLVKKSARSLSEKSLKVCTESLGSETGSDVFSFASSNASEEKQEQPQPQELQQQQQQQQQPDEDIVAKPAATLLTKKGQQGRSFPPPLPSLAAAHTDSPSLHMNTRRVDGRLVLEAVSVPPQKYFEAQRQDGRFLLTLINDEKQQPSLNEFVNIFNLSEEEQIPHNDYHTNDNNEDENGDEDEMEINLNNKDNIRIFKQQRPLNSPTGVMNVNKSTVTIKKITEKDNVNINYPTWSHKINTKLSKLEIVDEEGEEITPIVQSLPPRPTTGLPPRPPPQTATSVNTYQYFWRTKPSVASVIDPLIMTQHRPPTKTKDLVVLRGNKADCLLPSFKGCKEPRRSVMMWEPFCIATS